MPDTFKLTSWNVQHLEKLLTSTTTTAKRRRDAVVQEIRDIDADLLCVLEGPKGKAAIDAVCTDLLDGDYVPIKAGDGEYATLGSQWIWFLAKPALAAHMSLLPPATWDAFCGQSWPCYFWGSFTPTQHRHYRHPQVAILEKDGLRVEFIGLHLKSKYVNAGASRWKAGGVEREEFISDAIKARIKLTTEAANVRGYIDAKFEQRPDPAVFVLGDLNDGPGKEYFETLYLFHDLISNVQGDVFFARGFLNHALFDFPQDLRWTVMFKDFVSGDGIPPRDPRILLDHILFTQPLTDGSLPWKINENAGKVEHEIHELINANLPKSAHTSDHRPVSCVVDIA
jgi:hypothetical protein